MNCLRQRKTRSTGIAFVFFGIIFLGFLATAAVAEQKTITIGGSHDYPPYSYINERGEAEGFSVDLSRAIAEILNEEVDFELEVWGNVRKSMENRRTGLIHDMVHSEERELVYDFSAPYYISSYSVFAKKGSPDISTIEDLNGKRIIVVNGDIGHDYIQDQGIQGYIHLVDNYADAILLLEKGDFDYTMMDRLVGLYWIKTLGAENIELSKLSPFQLNYCYAALSENSELILKINGALAILQQNGGYENIYSNWMIKIDPWATDQEQVIKYLLLVATPLVLILLILFSWSWTLKKSVRQKTKDLYDELQQRKRVEEELRSSEKALAKEEELLRITLLSVGDGVIATDQDGRITMLNQAAEKLTGWTEKEALTWDSQEVFKIIYEDTRKQYKNPVFKALATRAVVEFDENTVLITKDGQERLIATSVAPIKNKEGQIKGSVLVFRDVTVERNNQKRIAYLSYHDQLTGLYNRRYLEEELKRLDKQKNLPLTIVMADVNGLKLINDSFGHATGDQLLKKVAEVIKRGCRADDIVSRIGGDEFVILLPRSDTLKTEHIVGRLQAMCSNEKVASIDISISFGWATKHSDAEDVLDVFKKAEDYMYKRKLYESPSMRGKTIGAIIKTLHEKNKREEQHSHRVSAYCMEMGKALGLSEGDIQDLKTGGLLHDIGKIAINENILNKTEALTNEQWEEIKRHPEIGYRILSSVNDLAEIAEHVLAHHERWDGGGYPKGLKGAAIPLQARIMAIADAYDAMTSERAYRGALPEEIAIIELQKNSGIQFDPQLVRAFIISVLGKGILGLDETVLKREKSGHD